MSTAVLLCLVVAITDGDTLQARCGSPGAYERIKVRLAEIDAPERRQAFGGRSRESLMALCHGQEAEIRIQGLDRYSRSIAHVTCRGQDANAEQIRRGMAWVYDRYVVDRSLYRLQDEARRARVGLWADAEHAVAPWVWRKLRDRRTD